MKEETEFNLSKEAEEQTNEEGIDNNVYYEEKVKEFIKRQIDRIDLRIEELSQFDRGRLWEVMLQKAELKKVKDDLLKDAGEKLVDEK